MSDDLLAKRAYEAFSRRVGPWGYTAWEYLDLRTREAWMDVIRMLRMEELETEDHIPPKCTCNRCQEDEEKRQRRAKVAAEAAYWESLQRRRLPAPWHKDQCDCDLHVKLRWMREKRSAAGGQRGK